MAMLRMIVPAGVPAAAAGTTLPARAHPNVNPVTTSLYTPRRLGSGVGISVRPFGFMVSQSCDGSSLWRRDTRTWNVASRVPPGGNGARLSHFTCVYIPGSATTWRPSPLAARTR